MLSQLLDCCCCCADHSLRFKYTHYSSCLLLVLTDTGHCFGSFISTQITEQPNEFGNMNSFVFSATPSLVIYSDTGR